MLLVAVPLAFGLVLVALSFWLWYQFNLEARQADRSKTVITHTNEVIESFNDVGIAFIVYDAATKPYFEEQYVDRVRHLRSEISILEKQVADDPRHVAIVKRAKDGAERSLRVLENRKKAIEAGGRLNLAEALDLKNNLNEIVSDLDNIIADEHANHEALAARRSGELLVFVFAAEFVGLSVVLPLAITIFYGGTNRRLTVLMDNSVRLGRGETLLPQLTGNDEIYQIDRAFHQAANMVREANRKERAVIDNAVDVICSISEDHSFAAVSPASEKLWGFEPAELIGRSWLEIIHPDNVNDCMNWAAQLRSKNEDGAIDTRVVRKSGSIMDMRWSAHWSSKERSMFCVAHDITERQELERVKQEFVAMISHDLRTPLTAVSSTLELLGTGVWGELTEKGQGKVSRAQENLQHTINLINNLLDLEKMQSGKIELQLSPVPMRLVLERCCSVVAPLAEAKSIAVSQDCEEGLQIRADAQRLAQVIINLLGNAIKFSPAESKVAVKIFPHDGYVNVSVSDEGPGIVEELRVKVFERYHQLPASGSERKEGTGLGLAICKAIVEAHGGKIWVESTAGKGSVFRFTIPA